ncbi:MAG: hypothetical protein H0T79_22925 [Deltaproteobacteria bacterium]|nr:hypothetical protein [Deltaproteobacteria bacterium]
MSKREVAVLGWSGWVGAIGGVLIGIGAALFAVALLAGSHGALIAGALALGGGGLAMAAAWCGLFTAGDGGVAVVVGSLALPVAFGAMFAAPLGPELANVRGLIAMSGLFVFALTHYFGIDGTRFAGARTTAGVALFGLGTGLLASTKRIPLPAAIDVGLAVIGIGGLIALGVVIAACMARVPTTPRRA